MSISWWTIVLQAINFLVLVWLLQRFLYKPALAVMARRRQQVEEAFEKAEQAKQAADTEKKAYQSRQLELDDARQTLLSRSHAEIAADHAKVVAEAHRQADALLAETRRQLEAERKAALAELQDQVVDLARTMATRLLVGLAAEPGTSTVLADVALAALEAHLDALSAEQRRALGEDLAGSTEALRITTAIELPPTARARWLEALTRRIEHIGTPVFTTDPSLVGGTTLRFPHAVLSLAWSDQLDRACTTLLADAVPH